MIHQRCAGALQMILSVCLAVRAPVLHSTFHLPCAAIDAHSIPQLCLHAGKGLMSPEPAWTNLESRAACHAHDIIQLCLCSSDTHCSSQLLKEGANLNCQTSAPTAKSMNAHVHMLHNHSPA